HSERRTFSIQRVLLSRKWLIAPDLNTRWSLESTALQWMLVPQQALITKSAATAGLLEGQRVAQCHRLAEDSKSQTAHAEKKGPGSCEWCPVSDQLP
ncbi:MAG: hypothetical protein NTZ40_15325, partial [Cyanobacteria bacterium]|nr:hypothetical protein [Cyanobacteriota bacterium]